MKQVTFKSKQAGFTLIELIVVIVILGVMAATALPKFADVGADARVAKMQAAQAAIKSVMAAASGSCTAQNLKGSSSCKVVFDGTQKTMVFGYPAKADIKSLAGLDDYDDGATAADGIIQSDSEHATCTVTYTEAADAATAATVALGATQANCK